MRNDEVILRVLERAFVRDTEAHTDAVADRVVQREAEGIALVEPDALKTADLLGAADAESETKPDELGEGKALLDDDKLPDTDTEPLLDLTVTLGNADALSPLALVNADAETLALADGDREARGVIDGEREPLVEPVTVRECVDDNESVGDVDGEGEAETEPETVAVAHIDEEALGEAVARPETELESDTMDDFERTALSEKDRLVVSDAVRDIDAVGQGNTEEDMLKVPNFEGVGLLDVHADAEPEAVADAQIDDNAVALTAPEGEGDSDE